MKKISINMMAIMMVVLMLITNTGCDITSAQSGGTLPKIVMVAPKGSLADDYYSYTAYDGVMRAASDYNMEVILKEPESRDDYIDAVSDAALEGADLVIAVGQLDPNSLTRIAKEMPETLFAVIDSSIDAPDNVMCLSFRDEEGAFLIGVISALTTETGVIGFIGGVENETVRAFEYGYKAGAKIANEDVKVIVEYIGSFNTPEAGAAAANSLIQSGADVIFHGAGHSGEGVVMAADEADIWAIGAYISGASLPSDNVLCSMYKRVDNGVYLSIQSFMEGKFRSGTFKFGLDFEAVGYSDKAGNLDKEIKSIADSFASDILAGNIKVPKNAKEFENFLIPDTEI